MPMKAHIEGTPSSICMASKERIAMHPAPRIDICSIHPPLTLRLEVGVLLGKKDKGGRGLYVDLFKGLFGIWY
jgi:hypothetical protein